MSLYLQTKTNLPKEIFQDMEKQFPPEEMKLFEEFNTLFEKTPYKCEILFDAKSTVGYILYLENEYLWVDYVAIFSEFHSKGYGSKIFEILFEKYSQLKGVFFEVEPENQENIQTIKRMNFYKKLGCKNLNFNYYYPNDIKKLKMELLFKPLKEDLPNKNEILNQISFVFESLHSNVKSKNETLELIKSNN